jgi:DNA-binding NarL/FixJ family response regulator
VNVVIADDQRIVREGLATIVGSLDGVEVVGVAATGA